MNKNFYPVLHENKDLSIAVIERTGSEELIFFIHGLGCAKEFFIDAWSTPVLEGYSLAAPDLSGFGESSKPPGFSYSMEAHAEVCLKVLKNFPHQKIHIAAHSMGGAVGLIMAESLGERLSSFINIEGNLISPDSSMSSLSSTLTVEKYHEHMIRLLADATAPLSKGGIKLWYHYIQKAGSIGLYRSARSLAEWSGSGKLLEIFKKLICRKIYIHGDANASMPATKHLEDIPRISIPGSGHFPMNDNSNYFYQSLEAFLKNE